MGSLCISAIIVNAIRVRTVLWLQYFFIYCVFWIGHQSLELTPILMVELKKHEIQILWVVNNGFDSKRDWVRLINVLPHSALDQ